MQVVGRGASFELRAALQSLGVFHLYMQWRFYGEGYKGHGPQNLACPRLPPHFLYTVSKRDIYYASRVN